MIRKIIFLLLICIFLFKPMSLLFAVDIEEKISELEESVKPPIIVIERPLITYDSQVYSDPFRLKKPAAAVVSEVEKEEPLPTLTIQGIVWGGTMPQAIINGKVAKIGDTIDGVKILDINKNGVDVIFNAKQYQISAPASMSTQEKKTESAEPPSQSQ